jgi:hypothetical protein
VKLFKTMVQLGTDMPFAEGAERWTGRIPAAGAIRRIWIRLGGPGGAALGNLQIVGAGAAGAVAQDAMQRLLPAVMFRTGTNDVHKSLSAISLFRKNELYDQIAPPVTQPADGAAGAHPVGLVVRLDFPQKGAREAGRYDFPTWRADGTPRPFELGVRFGTLVDAIPGCANAIVVATTTITVSVEVEYDLDKFSLDSYWVCREIERIEALPAAAAVAGSHVLALTSGGGRVCREVLLVATNNDVRSDLVVTDVELFSQSRSRGRLPWAALIEQTREAYQVAPAVGVTVLDFDAADKATPAEGDLPKIGPDAQPTLNLSHILATLPASLRIVMQELSVGDYKD